MEILHQGFDGFDLSLQVQISASLDQALSKAKEDAQKFRRQSFLDWEGVPMLVHENGATGGYSYMVRTAVPAAMWFFKKPNRRDPWGVRISCDSVQLASCGLIRTHEQLVSTARDLGLVSGEFLSSVGRLDYAVDLLAPSLRICPDNFVMHSNFGRTDFVESTNLRVGGKSGRVSSVTIGKMPGRQLIVYDKRAEIIAKNKLWWSAIWNERRCSNGHSALKLEDPETSRVWRVELRAGKRHLKDDWNIRTWTDVLEKIGDLFATMLQSIRYTEPAKDANRSRWPDHALWVATKAAFEDELCVFRSGTTPEQIRLVEKQAYDLMLRRQMLGLMISRAALRGPDISQLESFAVEVGKQLLTDIRTEPERIEKKLHTASKRLQIMHSAETF